MTPSDLTCELHRHTFQLYVVKTIKVIWTVPRFQVVAERIRCKHLTALHYVFTGHCDLLFNGVRETGELSVFLVAHAVGKPAEMRQSRSSLQLLRASWLLGFDKVDKIPWTARSMIIEEDYKLFISGSMRHFFFLFRERYVMVEKTWASVSVRRGDPFLCEHQNQHVFCIWRDKYSSLHEV